MPTRRRFALGLAATLFCATPLWAQEDAMAQSVARQLEAQGFSVTSIQRTLLGRVRVLAVRGDLQREIVFDPRNGTIMRDHTEGSGVIIRNPADESDDRDPSDPGTGGDDPEDTGGGSGGGSDDPDDDDDDDDDDGNDDGDEDDAGDDDGGSDDQDDEDDDGGDSDDDDEDDDDDGDDDDDDDDDD